MRKKKSDSESKDTVFIDPDYYKADITTYITDLINDGLYVAEIDTYDIVYINKNILDQLGNPPKEEWLHKKCYEILQHKTEPCDFCTNKYLKRKEFYEWEFFNPISLRHLKLKDTLIEINNKTYRLEVAQDITAQKDLERSLKEDIEEQIAINNCSEALKNIDFCEKSFGKLLKIIIDYFGASSAYIFELSNNEEYISEIYEKCAHGYFKSKSKFKNIRTEIVKDYFESLKKECILIQSIKNFTGKNIGFIGIENATKYPKKNSLLKVIAKFISDYLDRSELYRQMRQLSYSDALTNLKNRHSYIFELDKLQEKTPRTLGIAYIDVNGLKIANDTKGHDYGDELIQRLSIILTKLFKNTIYRIGGDEFVVLYQNIEKEDFKKKIEQFKIELEKHHKISASIGSSWCENCKNVLHQIEKAESLMYYDKKLFYNKIAE